MAEASPRCSTGVEPALDDGRPSAGLVNVNCCDCCVVAPRPRSISRCWKSASASMIRCTPCGSVSCRFAGRSESWTAELLSTPPMGADATRGLDLRASLLAAPSPRLEGGRLQSGSGPVERISPTEKECLGAAESNWEGGAGKGEEAAAFSFEIATSSVDSRRLSSSTGAGWTRCLDDTSTGVYFRSGYTRLIGLGIPVEFRLRAGKSSSAAILGVK